MGAKLTARDRQIAALIASGLTYTEAGAQLKLSERTVKRVMARPEVRAEVDAIRGRALEAGLGVMCENFTSAVKEMGRLFREGTPLDGVKLGAARQFIEMTLRTREQVGLVREVAELREMVREFAGGSEPAEADPGSPPGVPEGGREPERPEERPDGGTDPGGEPPGPVATEAADGWLGAGFIASVKASGQV